MALIPTVLAWRLRLPRPKAFLGFIPLQMGTELIALTLLFNKLTGLYGLLAILTGFSLSVMQLSAYLYNLIILISLAVCIPHIGRETPLPNLVLAWMYGVDTVINAIYTTAFAVSWYFATGAAADAAATAAINATASATTAVPAVSVATTSSNSVLTVTPTPRPRDVLTSATGTAAMTSTMSAASTANTTLAAAAAASAPGAGWMGGHETAASLSLIIVFTIVRFYFSLVVMSHTRQALRRYSDHVAEPATANSNNNNSNHYSGSDGDDDNDDEDGKAGRDDNDIDDEEAGLKSGKRSSRGGRRRRRDPFGRRRQGIGSGSGSGNGGSSSNPFAQSSPAGEGWRGQLGRALVKVGRSYWLGREPEDDDWARIVNAKFRT